MSDPALTAQTRRARLREQQEAQQASPSAALPTLSAEDLPGAARSYPLSLAGRDFVIERPEPPAVEDGRARQLNVPVPTDLDDVIVQMLHAVERSGYRKVTKALLIRAWLEVALEGHGEVQQIVDRAITLAYPAYRP